MADNVSGAEKLYHNPMEPVIDEEKTITQITEDIERPLAI